MPTFKRMTALRAGGLMLAAAVALTSPGARTSVAHAATEMTFTSPQEAYDQGLGAVRAGQLDIAVKAFEFSGKHNHVPALYYLGTIYANNDERLTDHAKAFNVFHRIVERHAYVDPVSDFRSVYVVRSAVRLADYYRSGVPALNLNPDPRAAVELLTHAATYFGDLEAQFQLAKMHLTGEGVEGNERVGLHWLSRLAHKNHPGAQAFLAELMWRGKFVHKDPNQALVWSTLSVEGASDHDRMWIEDVYQTIYCGAPSGVRQRAGQLVADWRRRAPSPPSHTQGSVQAGITGSTEVAAKADTSDGAAGRNTALARAAAQMAQVKAQMRSTPAAVRTCSNGEAVPISTVMPGGRELEQGIPSTMPGAVPAVAPSEPAAGLPGASTGRAPAAFGEGFTEFGSSPAARRR